MKKNNILLTFGIPMYNAEKYIERLIHCFDFTSNFPFEVIIINDGSNDESLEICKKYKNSIKLINQINQGVSCARNRIIDEAKGEWITFIDSDDLIDFQEYISEFKKNIVSGIDFVINVGNKKYYKKLIRKNNNLPLLITNEIINSPVANFYKREILINNNIRFNKKYSIGEDLLFNLFYYSKCKNIKYIHNSMMYIISTDNQNSLSRKYRDNKFDELMAVNDECRKIFFYINNNVLIYKSLEYIRVKACLSCVKDMILLNKVENNNLEIIKMKKYKKKQYLFLNNLFTSLIYNMWYFLPAKCIFAVVKCII